MRAPYFTLHYIIAGLLLFSGIYQSAQAQHQADTWYFGEKAGWNFSSGAPVPLLDSRMNTTYASTVMSDAQTGRLLFYSNGEQVWNRTHQLMPHGDSIQGTSSTGQGALIVPVPGEAQQYYLFTLRQRTQFTVPVMTAIGLSQLFYSIIDMRLQGGAGDVQAASKNTPLAGHLTEKLIAVPHANKRDYWVVVHDLGSSTFLVYGVTAAGVAPPIRQRVGPTHPANLADTARLAPGSGVEGQMQASPDGRYIACAVVSGNEPLSLFTFDAANGILAYQANLGPLVDASGVCFSPDNSKLYVQNYSRTPDRKNHNVLSQYDLLAGDSAAVRASGESVVVNNPFTNVQARTIGQSFYILQNGPDGRMYAASEYVLPGAPESERLQTFFVIGQPNARGFACEFNYQRFPAFGSRYASVGGLPNFIQSYFNGLTPTAPVACSLSSAVVFPNPTADVFYLRLPGECQQAYTITLYNALGQRIRGKSSTAEATGDVAVDVHDLAAGMYVVELRTAHERMSRKIVKY